MAPNPIVMKAVETLNYRVTVGDVASQVGLDIKVAEQALLGLASEAGGHLQVAESGEIAYLFPRNFRDVMRNKYWRLRFLESWNKVWRILFYLIRISFGVVLVGAAQVALGAGLASQCSTGGSFRLTMGIPAGAIPTGGVPIADRALLGMESLL
jgi:hypothetical protein